MHSVSIHLLVGLTNSTNKAFLPLLRVKEEGRAIEDLVAAEETVVKRVSLELRELQESQ